MKISTGLALLTLLLLFGGIGTGHAAAADDALAQPKTCGSCAKWNQPVRPFRVYGNTWYVGVRGLASVLVATPQGLILLDGDLPQSAPLIEASLRRLGYSIEDVKLILSSHAHFDHAGGIAALQRDSGAQVLASPAAARALRQGRPVADDPQAGFDDAGFPAVAGPLRAVGDGETLKLGGTAITAHFTPGHTPGGTTWTWKSCQDGRCLDIVYADSLTAVAAPGFRFSGDRGHPDRSQQFRASIDAVAALPCDVLITVHPEFGHLWQKLAARRRGVRPDPFIAPEACRAYAGEMRQMLDQRLVEEQAGSD